MKAEIFHRTWGGDESLIKQLEDLTPEFPFWARPLWRAFCAWLKPVIQKIHFERTMRDVDKQAKKIGNRWAAEARAAQVQRAVEKAQAEHPDAKVSVRHMPEHPVDAVVIEHPPNPDDAAQVLLGFGAIEIRAPYEH